MARGRQTRRLTPDQIQRLETLRQRGDRDHPRGFTLEQLNLAIAGPFRYRTVAQALLGKPIWSQSYVFLAQWIDRYLPPTSHSVPAIDAKSRAAGDKDDEEQIPADRTVRGSR